METKTLVDIWFVFIIWESDLFFFFTLLMEKQ